MLRHPISLVGLSCTYDSLKLPCKTAWKILWTTAKSLSLNSSPASWSDQPWMVTQPVLPSVPYFGHKSVFKLFPGLCAKQLYLTCWGSMVDLAYKNSCHCKKKGLKTIGWRVSKVLFGFKISGVWNYLFRYNNVSASKDLKWILFFVNIST